MDLYEFNTLDAQALTPDLKACTSIPAFTTALLSQRPFQTREALLTAARRNTENWSDTEITDALAHHPRIGEKKAARALSATEAAHSEREQAGVKTTDASEWEAANAAYEEKFGHVFLIRAAGRSSAEMLAELNRRMTNTAQGEAAERKQQLGEITLLRLKELVTA